MATVYSEMDSKALEATRSENSDLPPPYTAAEQQNYSYDQYDASKAAPSAPAGYYQPHPGYHPNLAGYSMTPGTVADDAWLMPDPPRHLVVQRQRESFVTQMILSCCVFWLCCWPLGLTAFILAMMANSRSQATDELSAAEAHRLGVHSWRASIAGMIIGAIIITTIIILQVTAKSG